MPELPKVTQEFSASNQDFLTALQEMIDQCDRLADAIQDDIDKIGELDTAIRALPDEKDIRVNITGDAMEDLGAILLALDDLPDEKTVLVNVIYKNVGNPEDIQAATQVIKQVVIPGESPGGAGGTVTEVVNTEDVDQAAEDMRNLGDEIADAGDDAAAAASKIRDMNEAAADMNPEDIQRAADSFEEVKAQAEEASASISNAGSSLDDANASADLLAAANKVLADAMDDDTLSASKLALIIERVTAAKREARLEASNLAAQEAASAAAAEAEAAAMDDLANDIQFGTAGDRAYLAALSGIADAQKNVENTTALLREAQNDANVAAAALSATEALAAEDTDRYNEILDQAAAYTVALAERTGQLGDALNALGHDAADSADDMGIFRSYIAAAGGDADKFTEDVNSGAPVLLAFAQAAKDAGGSVGSAMIPISAASFGITGLATAVHLIVMGVFEFAAVFLPAMYAAAAGAAVLSQGALDVYDKLVGVEDAGEALGPMLGKTQGDFLGLGHSLQVAQNEADPDAYELLGEAIIGVNTVTGNLNNTLGTITHTSSAASGSVSSFGQVGLEVGQILEKFGAEIDVDLTNNMGQVHELLSKAVSDLVEFGQILGNVGHAILNLASDMPGLAEIVLRVIDGFSELLKWVTSLPPGLITVVMAIEEAYRWSGLLAGAVGVLAKGIALLGTLGIPVIAKIGFNLGSMASSAISGIAGMITNFTALGQKIGIFGGSAKTDMSDVADAMSAAGYGVEAMAVKSSGSLEGLGEDALKAGGVMSAGMAEGTTGVTGLVAGLGSAASFMAGPWGAAIMLGVAGLTAFALYAAHSKSALDQTIDSMNAAVSAASNMTVLNVIASEVSNSEKDVKDNTVQAANALKAMGGSDVIGPIGALGGAYNAASGAAEDYKNEQNSLIATNDKVISNAAAISHEFGVSFTQALGIASVAGVKLSNTVVTFGTHASVAGTQIESLLLGYTKLSQSGNILANSMNAVNVQTQLQGTKVSQVNSAWDSFIDNATGLTNAISQVNLDLEQMGNISVSTGDKISAFTGTSTLSVNQIATSLKSFSGTSAQVWQAYDQTLTSTETFMDSLRTAAASGVVTQQQFTSAVADAAAQLAPYAKDSSAATAELSALVQEAGGPATGNFQTLKKWIDANATSSGNFTNMIDTLTVKMSNLTQIAANFAGTLQSDVNAAIAQGAVSTSNITGLTAKYTDALSQTGAQSATTKQAQDALTDSLKKYGYSTQDINQIENILSNTYANNTIAAKDNTDAVDYLTGKTDTLANNALPASMRAVDQVRSHTDQLTASFTGLTGSVGTAGSKAQSTADGPLTALQNMTISIHGWTSQLEKLMNDWPKSEKTTVTVSGQGGATIKSSIPGVSGGSLSILGHGLAGGGVIPGYSPGHDSVLAMLSPGEGVLVPQAVRAMGGEEGIRAVNKAAQHFAGGGVALPNIGGWASNFGGTATKDITDAFGEVLKEAYTTLNQKAQSKFAAEAATAAAGSGFANVLSLAKYLMAHGATAAAAAGIAGDVYGESGGNPEALEAGGGGGWGLIQWTGNTEGLPGGYSGPTGNATKDLDVQIAGVLGYIDANGGLGMLNAAGSADAAADIFSQYYLRPAVLYSDTRPAVAAQVYYDLMGAGAEAAIQKGARTQDAGGWIYPGFNLIQNKTGQIERTVPPGENGAGGMLHAEVHVDGKKLFDAMTPYGYRKASRNNGNATTAGYWAPGSR